MVETKYNTSHHAGGTPQERIANRLKPSAGAGAGDVQTTTGSGPNRVVHTIHNPGSARQHPSSADGPGVGRGGSAGRGRDE
jgi:hypothetical protein